MHSLLNQAPVLKVVSEIINDRVDLWVGTLVRRIPDMNHFSNWHDDITDAVVYDDIAFRRTVPLSLNLSSNYFEGGNLELRNAQTQEIIHDIPNKNFGDAIMFEISENLEHRVADVTSGGPRIVYVGWFHTRVD